MTSNLSRGYGTTATIESGRATKDSKALFIYAAVLSVTIIAVATIGHGASLARSHSVQVSQLADLMELAEAAMTKEKSAHADHLTASLLEQSAELESDSKAEAAAQQFDLHTERAIVRAKEDRRDSALKLAKAKELMDAAHNESQLSAMASSQGHVFDKSVLSEQAQLNQVKADIKTVKHRLAEATLSAQRAEKVMQTSVGLSSMRSRAVDAQQRLQHKLAAEAAADRVKAAVLRKRAAELEGANGASPLQMIADVTVSKLRNEARHEDERARALLDRQANVGKEVSVLSPSARQSQSEGDAVRARWAEKVRVEKYYQTKIQTLRKQERLIEKGFDGSMDSGSSLLARASTSASNAIKLRQEAELLQKDGMIEALDADKQETIARKYRNAAMRLRVQALAKQQAS